MLTPIILIIAGIMIGVLVKVAGRWVQVPYTVVLFAIGIGLGFLSQTSLLADDPFFTEGIRLISTMNPDFILYVFLPILVFDAAYEMDLHVFKKTLLNASLLAGPGLVICMLLTAGLVMAMHAVVSGYDPTLWPFALMFGGLISATDPVAVVALLQELGTKKRFSTLVDGESLLNDGTGLVCFMMFYSTYAGQGDIDHPLLYFIWVVVASTVIGMVFARLAIWLVERVATEEVLQNSIMVAGAYLTFMLAQKAFDVSGVIALVVFGHLFAQSCRPHLKPATNEWMGKFWSLLAYLANTFIFLIVGIIIATRVHITWQMIGGIFLVYVGLNVIRYIMIVMLMPLLRTNGYGLSWRESVILGWGGLRGALGMCMALMVSCNTAIPENIRNYILIYTAGVVTLTLCINATTSKWMVSKLRLIDQKSASERQIWQQMLSLIRRKDQETIDTLKKDAYLAQANWAAVEEKMIAVPEETVPEHLSEEEVLCVLRRNLLAHIEMVTNDYYHKGVLNYRSYEHILSSLAVLSDFEGHRAFDEMELKQDVSRRRWFEPRRRFLTEACNLCRGYVIIFMEAIGYIDKVVESNVMNLSEEQQTIDKVKGEISNLICVSSELLETYRLQDPQVFADGVTDKATRMLLAAERAQVEQLIADGILSQESADLLLNDIAKRQGLEIVN